MEPYLFGTFLPASYINLYKSNVHYLKMSRWLSRLTLAAEPAGQMLSRLTLAARTREYGLASQAVIIKNKIQ